MSLIVTINDAAAIGYCRKGCRRFAERYGLDYPTFLSQGLPVSAFDGIDDSMVTAVIEQAKKRMESENG